MAGGLEHLHAVTVVADQSAHGSDPQQATAILRQRGRDRVGKPLGDTDIGKPWADERSPRVFFRIRAGGSHCQKSQQGPDHSPHGRPGMPGRHFDAGGMWFLGCRGHEYAGRQSSSAVEDHRVCHHFPAGDQYGWAHMIAAQASSKLNLGCAKVIFTCGLDL